MHCPQHFILEKDLSSIVMFKEVCSTPSLTKIFERPAFLILNTPVLYVMNPFLMTYRDILKCEIALCQRPVHTVLNHLMMSLV